MANVKVMFLPSNKDRQDGVIFYMIIHENKARKLFTDYHILQSQWDRNDSRIILDRKSPYISGLITIRENIRHDIERITRIIKQLEHSNISYTVDEVIDSFKKYCDDYSLSNYMENMIGNLKQMGRMRTADTYRVTLNKFMAFNNGVDIMLDCLTAETLKTFEAWLINNGLTWNTVSFYMRILRAVYHRAAEEGAIENRLPFRHVYTGIDKTVKRALPLHHIKRIKMLDLSAKPSLDYARDIFLLSFMLRGMSFIDMTYLKKSDKINGYIIYRRRKSGQQLTIQWTREMQRIVDKYPRNKSPYLLPIIRDTAHDDRQVYRNVAYNVNYSLKAIGKMIGISIPLTLYVARHSWASVAKDKGIPVSVISEGMGHYSETTTQIYLASLDTSVVDKANNLIIKSL